MHHRRPCYRVIAHQHPPPTVADTNDPARPEGRSRRGSLDRQPPLAIAHRLVTNPEPGQVEQHRRVRVTTTTVGTVGRSLSTCGLQGDVAGDMCFTSGAECATQAELWSSFSIFGLLITPRLRCRTCKLRATRWPVPKATAAGTTVTVAATVPAFVAAFFACSCTRAGADICCSASRRLAARSWRCPRAAVTAVRRHRPRRREFGRPSVSPRQIPKRSPSPERRHVGDQVIPQFEVLTIT